MTFKSEETTAKAMIPLLAINTEPIAPQDDKCTPLNGKESTFKIVVKLCESTEIANEISPNNHNIKNM